jgi:hypothetical protein
MLLRRRPPKAIRPRDQRPHWPVNKSMEANINICLILDDEPAAGLSSCSSPAKGQRPLGGPVWRRQTLAGLWSALRAEGCWAMDSRCRAPG